MSATVTNQDLGVTTKTSGHTASTEGPSDVCYDPPKVVPTPHVNNVTTDRAVEHTTGKTLFQGGNVVRLGEAITPSEPAHGDSGGGVVSGTYRAEARPTRGSPNVRTEGKPPARTDDPTTQNHGNTTGKIFQTVPPHLLVDNPEEFLKRCSYKESTIQCDHQPAVNDKEQIDVWRGDSITVIAKRFNAKEPGKDPACIRPPHMKWKVTRSGGIDALGGALPEMSEEFEGDTLVLPGVWTGPVWYGPMGTLVYEGEQDRNLSRDAQRYYVDQKNRFAQSNATARGSSRVEGQDTRAAYQEVRNRIDQTDRYHDPRLNQARAQVQNLVNLAQFLVAWRSAQNPVKTTIVGNACSGSVSYTVHSYPNSKYNFTLPLDGIIEAGRWVSRSFEIVKSFGQLANTRVDGGFKIPGDVSIGLEFQWKEQDKEDVYRICREAELSIQGQFFELKAEVAFPLTNLLAIIPGIGPVAARAVGWLAQRIGADLSIGAGFKISCSAACILKFKWTAKDGWVVDSGGIKLPIDLQVYAFIRIRPSDSMYAEGQLGVTADPALLLEVNSDGVNLKSDDFMVRIGITGVIHVDTWFYTFHEQATWYPESWTWRIDSIPIKTLIGN
ncbi:PAAR-like domain-containing protein [Polyangium aurulentum]|uniref:PAAR-like domain-containing protein n=1 Tax=Polyangium aurulentum TaxID=2567896 RepID=UPI0010AEBF7F|nr:PAAR-like domain-containing protein [Polyangium aurulentum]UQA63165.1 DUF4150 domain-containing protein [Polyangium aurulentum]